MKRTIRPGRLRTCSCRTWGLLDPLSRDYALDELMCAAALVFQVQVKLLARGEHVAICDLMSFKPGEGRARTVMTELCTWADCSRVALELTPSDHWGSDVDRLTRFYASLGFEPNNEPRNPFRVQGSVIRYPMKGRGHETVR